MRGCGSFCWFVSAMTLWGGEGKFFPQLQEHAKALAAEEYDPAPPLPAVLDQLNYDQFRAIKTAENAVIWSDRDSLFQVELLHAGYLFKRPVKMNFLDPGEEQVTAIPFEKRRFNYEDLVVHDEFSEDSVGGYSGFRLRFPLNGGPEDFDEIGSFVASCYVNCAACFLKDSMWREAVFCCSKALILEPHNVKALFRRAKAQHADQTTEGLVRVQPRPHQSKPGIAHQITLLPLSCANTGEGNCRSRISTSSCSY